MFYKKLRSLLIAVVLLTGLANEAFSAVSVLGHLGNKGVRYFSEILQLGGMGEPEAKELVESLKLSFKALNNGTEPKTQADFARIMNSTPELKKLSDVLNMDADKFQAQFLKEIKSADGNNPRTILGDLLTTIGEQGDIHGKGAFAQCSSCVSEWAHKFGIGRVAKALVKGSLVQGFIATAQKMGSGKLLTAVKRQATKLRMSRADRKAFFQNLKQSGYAKMYAALRSMQEGTPTQIAFGDALAKFCRIGKKITTYNFCMRLMHIVVDEPDQVQLANWTSRLTKVASEAPKKGFKHRLNNLRQSFLEQAQAAQKAGNEKLMKLFRQMDEKLPCACFWGTCRI